MKKERAPAQIVSCPHCDWKGSARGLYTHCRMGHPDKPTPNTRGNRVTIHPQAEKPPISLKKGNKRKSRWTDHHEERYQRLLKIIEVWVLSQYPPEYKPVTQLAGIPKDIEKKVERLKSDDILTLIERYKL